MLTVEDTALLEGAGALLKETRRQIARLNEEVIALRKRNGALKAARDRAETDRKLLRARLCRPDALDAELWRERAEFWEEQARVLKLANKSFAETNHESLPRL